MSGDLCGCPIPEVWIEPADREVPRTVRVRGALVRPGERCADCGETIVRAGEVRAVIMIGASGSGKSTRARTIADAFRAVHGRRARALICSADDYLGLYDDGRLRPELLGEAHGACLRTWIDALRVSSTSIDVDLLVSDNTNTTAAEVAPYIATARAYGVEPEILYFDPGSPPSAEAVAAMAARGRHGAAPIVVEAQAQRAARLVDDWPPFWPLVEYQAVKS